MKGCGGDIGGCSGLVGHFVVRGGFEVEFGFGRILFWYEHRKRYDDSHPQNRR